MSRIYYRGARAAIVCYGIYLPCSLTGRLLFFSGKKSKMQHVPAQSSSQVTLSKEMAHACSLCTHYNSYKSCWAVHGSSGVHVQFREAKKTFLLNVLFWTVKCKMFLFNFFYSYDVLISFYIFKLAQHFKLVLFYLVILIKHFKLFRFIRYMVIILTIKPGNNYFILLF